MDKQGAEHHSYDYDMRMGMSASGAGETIRAY
jgi:hypothetical protein